MFNGSTEKQGRLILPIWNKHDQEKMSVKLTEFSLIWLESETWLVEFKIELGGGIAVSNRNMLHAELMGSCAIHRNTSKTQALRNFRSDDACRLERQEMGVDARLAGLVGTTVRVLNRAISKNIVLVISVIKVSICFYL
jgi:hypothetical protein